MERDEHILKSFGERVKSLREKKGWTQLDLAFEANVDPRTISRIENGKSDARLSMIISIGNALECKIEELIQL